MPGTLNALEPGDVVEILYRLWRPVMSTDETRNQEACHDEACNDEAGRGDEVVERWISAHVVFCEPGTWPLARLADGQRTEIRPFMTWRVLARASARAMAA